MQVKVQYLNEPKKHGDAWTIKTDEGKYIYIQPEMATKVRPGEVYDLDVEEKTSKTGRAYFSCHGFAAANRPLENSTQNHRTANMTPATAQSAAGGSFSSKDEMIFVCGFVNNWVRACAKDTAVGAVVLTDLVNVAREAWANTFGNGGKNDISF